MTRRAETGMWITLVAVCVIAGIAIAGTPQLGADPPTRASTEPPPDGGTSPEADTTTTTSTTSTTTTEPTTTTTTTTSTTEPTTTTEPEARPNDEVPVLVANGTDVVGAAGRVTDELAAQGHPTSTPLTTSAFEVSEVWFTDGFGVEAVAIAERLGVFPENVMAMPDNPGFAIGGAAVVVVLGPELAGG